ncbi:MAG TPA: hypothetical protein PLZ43_15125 [bacterium]|nr:hypothetical protein [bacterium]
MKDFITGFKHGVLELYDMSFSLLNFGAVKPSESDTSEKPVPDREYIPNLDYRQPEDEYPVIKR